MKKTIFVVGAGKGLGNAVAKKFGQNDFKVVLMSRNAENLETYKAEFDAEGLEAEILVADTADGRQFAATLNRAKENYGTPDVLFYNVGITTPDDTLPQGVDAELLMQRYQIDVAGAYTAVQTIMDDEFAGKEGSILITGGGLAMYPYAGFLPLSMDKAALRAMVLALNPVYKEKGVFIGAVQVCDTIGGSEKYMPVNIAEKFWELYQNRSDAEIVY
jgi:NADP-dependent 3-hydroxy acid dehydrogenase YdfG